MDDLEAVLQVQWLAYRQITDEFDVNSKLALKNYDVFIVWAREILAMAKTSITIAAAP